MAGTEQTMKEVVDRLRRENSKAVEEVVELHVAVKELLRAQQYLRAGLCELSVEAATLVELTECPRETRLQNIAAHAARLCDTFGVHIAAFGELALGVAAWHPELATQANANK